nr:hypothetical protein 4 [Pseudomonadaceae bacterium]
MEVKPRERRVSTVSWHGHLKRIVLRPGKGSLYVPRSACVGSGARVRLVGDRVSVVCKEGLAQILPAYFATETLRFDGLSVELAVKEITETDEYESYLHLSNLHYRGHEMHGRTAKLILRSFHPAFPTVVGYIELATPFLMNKARAQVMDARFENGSVKWERWDKESLRRYIHLIVRIGRIVVAPEFRGLGVAKTLLKHAISFAKDRWQIAETKPYFIEISADMLRYVPVAQAAGMSFVGETEGNLDRVVKDMRYLIGRFGKGKKNKEGERKFERSCGICDEQLARMNSCLKVMRQEDISVDDLMRRLASLSRERVLRDFALFRDIVVLPKPHFMKGLNPQAEDFLQGRLAVLTPTNGHAAPNIAVCPIREPIRIDNLSVTYESEVRRTRSTHAIQQAFGIAPDVLTSPVISELSLVIQPGEVLVVTGPSGSGKSSFLRLVEKAACSRAPRSISRSIRAPKNSSVGSFLPIRSQKPLIELLGIRTVGFGLHVLSLAGLAEAYVYLKRFDELSAGQQYRAMLAMLMASQRNVWLADEFCSNLDPVTASVVAHNLQRIARKTGATVILAAPDCTNFVHSLNPDRILLLRSSTEHVVMSGAEYLAVMATRNRRSFRIPRLRVSKNASHRLFGEELLCVCGTPGEFGPIGIVLLDDGSQEIPVSIRDVRTVASSQLTRKDAQAAGFNDLSGLRRSLSRRYGKKGNKMVLVGTARRLCSKP